MIMIILPILAFVVLLPQKMICSPPEDLMSKLPSISFDAKWRQFSGYLNASKGHFLHYWLVESQSNPESDPVIVWFNGGPGCSSLTGMLYELGPTFVNEDGKTLFENVYAWNKAANVIVIESPIGVGFSYSDDQDYRTGDDNAAFDNYLALKYFFHVKFPELKGRPFFISGESYCGVYIPMLAKLVTDGMRNGDFPTNLTGISIGNGIFSERRQHNSIIDYMYNHGIIGRKDRNDLLRCCGHNSVEGCDFVKYLKLLEAGGENFEPWHPWGSDGTFCSNLTYKVTDQYVWNSLNDEYNIYLDCYDYGSKIGDRLSLAREQSYPTLMKYLKKNQAIINTDSTDANGGFSCYGQDTLTTYLNQPDVQNALNIPEHVIQNMPNKTWTHCSIPVYRYYDRTHFEMDDIMDGLVRNTNIRIMIYNGDVDMVCNFLGDEWFSEELGERNGLPTTKTWGPWMFRGQIAGYSTQWTDRLNFMTIKGAGHFSPTDRPGPSLQLIMNFIKNSRNYSEPTGFSNDYLPLITSSASNNSSLFVILVFDLFILGLLFSQ